MSSDDFRPRIDSEIHRKIRLYYFDENISDYSAVYEELANMVFTEEGNKKQWYSRVEKLSENYDISFEEAMNNLVVSALNDDGEFKPGAKQMYVRSNSLGE